MGQPRTASIGDAVLDHVADRSRRRMGVADHVAPEIRPLVWAVNDEDMAKRLWAVGARTFEDAERMLPCLAWLERELVKPPAEGRLHRTPRTKG